MRKWRSQSSGSRGYPLRGEYGLAGGGWGAGRVSRWGTEEVAGDAGGSGKWGGSRQHEAPEEGFPGGGGEAGELPQVDARPMAAEEARACVPSLRTAQGSGKRRWLGSAAGMSFPTGLEPVSTSLFRDG